MGKSRKGCAGQQEQAVRRRWELGAVLCCNEWIREAGRSKSQPANESQWQSACLTCMSLGFGSQSRKEGMALPAAESRVSDRRALAAYCDRITH